MKTNKIIGLLGIATLLGACGGAADGMLTGLDESQITTSIRCGDSLNALIAEGHGGTKAPVAIDSVETEKPIKETVESIAPVEEAVESIPGHGGTKAPVAEPVESIPGHGGTKAPLTLNLMSDLDCSSYQVEINGTNVDGEAVVMTGAGIEAAVEVTDGTFVHTFNTDTLGEYVLENM